jgi:hypothetical protein
MKALNEQRAQAEQRRKTAFQSYDEQLRRLGNDQSNTEAQYRKRLDELDQQLLNIK